MKFLPQRATIDAFGNGGFRFAGMSHQGSLLILPSGMRAWDPNDLATAKPKHFAEIIAEQSNIDMLLVGTGTEMLRLPQLLIECLTKAGLRFDGMSTSAAVRTYNVVLAEDRRVAAVLIAVDKAHDRA